MDTRTDVYSLGVLLYELLTGTTPFDKERLKNSGLDEVKRIIREEEPPKPSTRLSTLGAALDTVVEKHHTDRRTLTNELTGELDWIVMKALEKDRYAAVRVGHRAGQGRAAVSGRRAGRGLSAVQAVSLGQVCTPP